MSLLKGLKKKSNKENTDVNEIEEQVEKEVDYTSEEAIPLIREEYDIVWVNDKVEEVIDYFTQVRPDEMNLFERKRISKDAFLGSIEKYIVEHIVPQSKLVYHNELAQEYIGKILDGFKAFVWSYDVIDTLIADRDISDIKIYDYDHIRIKKLGKRMGTDVKFRDQKQYKRFVSHVAVKNKVSISNQNALQRFVDAKTSPDAILRFNISTEHANVISQFVSIVFYRRTSSISWTKNN